MNISTPEQKKCPCDTERLYSDCCEPYLTGQQSPANPEALMRSRYSAFAVGKVDYIIATTHRNNPMYDKNRSQWRLNLAQYCRELDFQKLEIAACSENTVTFTTHVIQNNKPLSITETSTFVFENNKWWYLSWKIEGKEGDHHHHDGCCDHG